MSRFLLDCAVLRPVDDQSARWHATALQRGWASPTAGYHEGKVSAALREQSAATMARLVGARSAWFVPDTAAAVHCAVADVLAGSAVACVATCEADTLVVQETTADLARAHGLPHAVLGVDSRARVPAPALDGLPTPAVVVTNAANQELGGMQTDLSEWSRRTGSAVVLDASAAFGWTDLPPGWARLVLDARAWGSVPGAVAVCSNGPGAEARFDNVPAAVVAGLTAERWLAAAPRARQSVRRQIEHIASRVRAELDGVEVRGGGPQDLPHILSISVLYVDAEAVQTRLDARGFAVGSGSACASRTGQPSHVLAAVGGLTSGNLRIGLPPGLDDEVVTAFVDALVSVVTEVRDEMGTRDL